MSNDFYQLSILPYAGIIVRLCRAYTDSQEEFEDYYQEVCLQIWKSRNNFNEKSQWSTWVYRLTLNVCLSLSRNKKKLGFTSELNDHVDLQLDQIETEKNFATEDLYNAIKQLSTSDRALILLYLEEKSHQEMAEILGTNANNIGVRVNRIKKRLKVILTKN